MRTFEREKEEEIGSERDHPTLISKTLSMTKIYTHTFAFKLLDPVDNFYCTTMLQKSAVTGQDNLCEKISIFFKIAELIESLLIPFVLY